MGSSFGVPYPADTFSAHPGGPGLRDHRREMDPGLSDHPPEQGRPVRAIAQGEREQVEVARAVQPVP